MKFAEFKDAVKDAYKKYFPESQANVRIFNCLGKALTIDCFLAGDLSEIANSIPGNDMFWVQMWIDLPKDYNKENDLPDTLVMEWQRSSVAKKPEQKYLAYGAEKVKYRKVSGDAKKIVKALDKYFSRLHDTVVNLRNNDLIHEEFADLVNQKIA